MINVIPKIDVNNQLPLVRYLDTHHLFFIHGGVCWFTDQPLEDAKYSGDQWHKQLYVRYYDHVDSVRTPPKPYTLVTVSYGQWFRYYNLPKDWDRDFTVREIVAGEKAWLTPDEDAPETFLLKPIFSGITLAEFLKIMVGIRQEIYLPAELVVSLTVKKEKSE